MTKSRPFSIYLLKTGVTADTALRQDHELESAVAQKLPEGSSLFILDSDATRPWWREYFGVEKEDLWQQQKGALVFLPVGDRCFALSFGQALHHLDERAFEYDFGLRVTLNSLDPKHLKSADMVSPGAARRKRTQVPSSTDLTYLDFDGNSEIIRSLTGSVRAEYKELFKNATGSSSLKISLKLSPSELVTICEKLLKLYKSEYYLENFPNIQNISPVSDPETIENLDAQLVSAFRSMDEGLALGIPDIIDYRDNTCCIFDLNGAKSEVTPEISLESLSDFAEAKNIDLSDMTLEQIKASRIIMTDYDGKPSKSFGLYRSLIFDAPVSDDGLVYHLCESKWYQVEQNYLDKLTIYIDQRCEDTDLPSYNHDETKNGKRVYSEGAYNAAVPNIVGSIICLDQTDISPNGNTAIEPCDLYKVVKDASASGGHRAIMYGVKISTRSAQLSHLFNQGLNSVEIIRQEQACRDKIKILIADRIAANDSQSYTEAIDNSEFKVIFGIITDKDKNNKSNNLPLFSKISLMRTMQRLDLMRIPASLTFIPDESPAKDGYARYPTLTVEVGDSNGKTVVQPVPGQGADPTKAIARCPKDVRESPAGTRFRMVVKTDDKGDLSTHHGWPLERLP
ncbi:MAG: TIGR04141 family sporadically distributed protein [Candidatus Brevundimonas phytovorans]|nr:DUF6119 family protein [Brevundimonas sp.]WEK58260.1 MAG: TIGR04141 family sporadically distributed protein [Brevundimonas sp.]